MPAEELVDIVDEEDTVVGAAPLRECLVEGLLHRAVAVIVLRGNGSMLLQQRSKRDIWHPGLWTLSCTGHVRKGERYRDAARRELREELGLRSPIRAHSKIRIPALRSRGLTENEWVKLFVSKSNVAVVIDPLELEGVEEVPIRSLRQMLQGRNLTADAKTLLKHYLDGSPNPHLSRSHQSFYT